MQLNQLKHKQIPPQFQLPKLTYDSQYKPEHYLVKHETVLPEQMDECHPTLADFGNHQLFFPVIDKGENIISKGPDQFSFEAVKPFQSQYKKTNHQKKALIITSENSNGSDTNYDDHLIEKNIPQNDDSFPCCLSLIKILSGSEKNITLKIKFNNSKLFMKHVHQ